MNIWTWNVNSIRNKMDLVNDLLNRYNIDILVVTETKIQSNRESSLAALINPNYKVLWNSNKISYYHGTALIYKKNIKVTLVANYLPRSVSTVDMNLCGKKNKKIIMESLQNTNQLTTDCTNAHKHEGRIITAYCQTEDGKIITVVGSYVPNSGTDRKDPLKRLAYRTTTWDKDMYQHLLNMNKQCDNVVWLGDLNVARHDHDINKPRSNYAGVTQEERYNMNQFIDDNGWIDTWDYNNPQTLNYKNRWTYGMAKQTKLRLDYVICSPQMKDMIVWSGIDHEFEGSDHVPMGTIFNL